MRFLSFIIFCMVFTTVTLSQTWNAVCAGINDYPGGLNDLGYCVNDVTVMRQNLINYKQWESIRIDLLTNSDATENNIRTAIDNMPTTTGNTNLFHFAGHGDSEEDGGTDGLQPANLLTARITQSELQSSLGSTYNQCTTFLDACCTGIFSRDMTIGVICSACRADEHASESSQIEHILKDNNQEQKALP